VLEALAQVFDLNQGVGQNWAPRARLYHRLL
jgi:hypothetical protein